MMSVFLKRVLPFALTLLVGVVLGGFTSLFRAGVGEQPAPARVYIRERRESCGKYFNSRGVGRLVSIERRTEAGEWVPTRLVTPEIYELKTRPAIIRSRPEALYTEEARSEGVSGTVALEATLGADGRVTDIRPQWSLAGGLTEQAVAAARRLDFMPAIKDDEPVAQRIRLEYRFER